MNSMFLRHKDLASSNFIIMFLLQAFVSSWFIQATICHYFLDGLFFEKCVLTEQNRDRDSSGNPFAFDAFV